MTTTVNDGIQKVSYPFVLKKYYKIQCTENDAREDKSL